MQRNRHDIYFRVKAKRGLQDKCSPNEALLFKDLENVWGQLTSIYNGDFKSLVYGTLPKETSVLESLRMVRERLDKVQWAIQIKTKE